MNLASYKSFLRVLTVTLWIGASSCSGSHSVSNPSPALQQAVVSEGQAPLLSREVPVDVETFLAFCDRA
jgi:hypothetical protein